MRFLLPSQVLGINVCSSRSHQRGKCLRRRESSFLLARSRKVDLYGSKGVHFYLAYSWHWRIYLWLIYSAASFVRKDDLQRLIRRKAGVFSQKFSEFPNFPHPGNSYKWRMQCRPFVSFPTCLCCCACSLLLAGKNLMWCRLSQASFSFFHHLIL